MSGSHGPNTPARQTGSYSNDVGFSPNLGPSNWSNTSMEEEVDNWELYTKDGNGATLPLGLPNTSHPHIHGHSGQRSIDDKAHSAAHVRQNLRNNSYNSNNGDDVGPSGLSSGVSTSPMRTPDTPSNDKARPISSSLGGVVTPLRTGASTRGVPHVERLSLLYDPPVEGCELKPYTLLRTAAGKSLAVQNAKQVKFQWSRGQKRTCSANHCAHSARFQCVSCVKAQLPVHMSYFCSKACWMESWSIHRQLHRNSATHSHPPNLAEAYDTWDENERKLNVESEAGHNPDSILSVTCRYPVPTTNIWTVASNNRIYIPQPADVGCALKLQVAPLIPNPYNPYETPSLGEWREITTSGVMRAASDPPPRHVIYTDASNLPAKAPFAVMCYNILAEIYCNRSMYPYTPLWALQWSYRRKVILRHILAHDAPIVALQEVQADHYENFLLPEMKAVGYEGAYTRKKRESVGVNAKAVDGCAIFFKRDRFAMIECHTLDFNKLAEKKFHRRSTLKRLLRGNIALVVILEDLMSPMHSRHGTRGRRICVTNTHIFWDPDYADVKLWQTLTLCRELEKIVLPRNLPLIICGDFNSKTDSSVYELLCQKTVRGNHPEFDVDPAHIMRDSAPISHHLPLTSAYSFIGEPKFTNYTGHFVGVLDYILYSQSHLQCTHVLDIDEEDTLKTHTALPNPQHGSDHCSLVSMFDWVDE